MQDVSGYFDLRRFGQLHHDALGYAATEGHPDQLAGFNGKCRRYTIGKGARVADGSINRHLRIPHDVPRPAYRNRAGRDSTN